MNLNSKAAEMSDDEVQYASVIKWKGRPKAKTEEEVVYDEVKIANPTVQQKPDNNGPLSDKEAEGRCWYQKMACCFMSVILVMAIIGLCVYFVFLHKHDKQELKQLKANQTFLLEEMYNLTSLNNELRSDFNLQIHNLITELSQVKKKNQELQREKTNLKDQIQTKERTWNEQKANLTQWSINEYCLKGNDDRKCGSCQTGWEYCRSSCYAVNNADHENQKTWLEARADCKGKNSDLTVVSTEREKMYVDRISWAYSWLERYWIGLTAVEGKWKWINGSELTNQEWIQHQPATDGQCVTSLQSRKWKSVSCNETNGWICEKKALSV